MGLHTQVNQTGQGEIDLGDFFKIYFITDATKLLQFVLGEDLGHGLAQFSPLLAVQLNVGAGELIGHIVHGRRLILK